MQFTFLVAFVNISVVFSVIRAQIPSHYCKKLLNLPNFDVDRVVGKPWRVYYTWIMDYGERCVEITLKKLNRTSGIKRRFASNMDKYMIDKVVWEDATLLVSKSPLDFREGEVTKEMLLFPKGEKGYFDGVHDFADQYLDYLPRRSVPLKQYVFKLFRQGKYLVMADCSNGMSFLMARPNDTINRLEILSLAGDIWEESGYTTCSSEKEIKEGNVVFIDDNTIM